MSQKKYGAKRGSEKKHLKKKKGRKASSHRWLERQLNDPYVQQAQSEGYRSRASFKLLQLNEKFKIFSKGDVVLDLGSAPGGWSQVVISELQGGHVAAVDLLDMDPLPGVEFIKGDIEDPAVFEKLKAALGQAPDVVMSDMAANTVGHAATDHLRTEALAELAADVALELLKPGGHFVAKVFQGGAHKTLLNTLKQNFETVKHFKPAASRKGSPETYVVAMNRK